MSQEEKVADNFKRKLRREFKTKKRCDQRTIFESEASPGLSQIHKGGKMENLQDYDFKFLDETNFSKQENSPEDAPPVSQLSDLLKNLKTTDKTLVVLKAIMAKLSQAQRDLIFQEFGNGDALKNLKIEVAELQIQNENFESERQYYQNQITKLENELKKVSQTTGQKSPTPQHETSKSNADPVEEINTSLKSDFQIESDLQSPHSPDEPRPGFVDNEVHIPMNGAAQGEINFDDFIEIDPNDANVDQDDHFSEQLEQMAEDNDHLVDQIEFSLLNQE